MFLQSMSMSLVPALIVSYSNSVKGSLAQRSAGMSAKSSSQSLDRACLSVLPTLGLAAAEEAYEPTPLSVLERGPKKRIIGVRAKLRIY